jgi:hypothetical protein
MTQLYRADVVARGPINGMGEPDQCGSYVELVVTSATPPASKQRFRISLGAAKALAAELEGLKAMKPLEVRHGC